MTNRTATEDEWSEAIFNLFPANANLNAAILEFDIFDSEQYLLSGGEQFRSLFITLMMDYHAELQQKYIRNLDFDLFKKSARADVPIKEAMWLQNNSFATDFNAIGIPVNLRVHLSDLVSATNLDDCIAILSNHYVQNMKKSQRSFEITKRTAFKAVTGEKTVSEKLASYVFFSFLNVIDLSNAPVDVTTTEVNKIKDHYLEKAPAMMTSLNELNSHLFDQAKIANIGGFIDLFLTTDSRESRDDLFNATVDFDKDLAIAATGLITQ